MSLSVVPSKQDTDERHDITHASFSSAGTAFLRSVVASTLFGLTVMFAPFSHASFMLPLPAFATTTVEQQHVVTTIASTSSSIMDRHQPDPSTASSPDDIVVGIPPLPKLEESTLELLQPSSTETSIPNNKNNQYSPVEEVWTLIDKYYIDKTYNGQVCVVVLLSVVCMCKFLLIHVLTCYTLLFIYYVRTGTR